MRTLNSISLPASCWFLAPVREPYPSVSAGMGDCCAPPQIPQPHIVLVASYHESHHLTWAAIGQSYSVLRGLPGSGRDNPIKERIVW